MSDPESFWVALKMLCAKIGRQPAFFAKISTLAVRSSFFARFQSRTVYSPSVHVKGKNFFSGIFLVIDNLVRGSSLLPRQDQGVFTRIAIVSGPNTVRCESAASVQSQGNVVGCPHFEHDPPNALRPGRAQKKTQERRSQSLAAQVGSHGDIEYFHFIVKMPSRQIGAKSAVFKGSHGQERVPAQERREMFGAPGIGKELPFQESQAACV